MADAKRDNNVVTTLIAVSSADGITPVVLWADPTTHRLLVDSSGSGANTALSNLAAVAINAALLPGTSDSIALGSATKMWSDLFLGDGAVINFNNSDVTITHGLNVITVAGGDLALGANNLTITGSIGATGARSTKGWFTDLESTNMPTVGGTAILTSLTAPQFTTIELGHASDTTLSRSSAGVIAVEGVTVALNSTSAVHIAGTIELGAASDTTISRVSAGLIAVEGVTIVDVSTAQTLTNKTLTSPVMTAPVLGTPASGVGTNLTGIPAAAILAGSFGAGAYVISTSLQVATLELGAATDTTITRVSAGLIAVEGITVVDVSTAQTLTNKTLTSPVLTTPSAFTTGGNITLAENTSIDLDPAGSADGKYTGICITGTAGATIAFGDLIYLAVATSKWVLTDADALSTSGNIMIGMCVLAAVDTGATKILLMGQIRADAKFPALTIGAAVYVGETAGAIQVAIPTGADNVIRVVGFALTADEIYFNPSQDHQTTVA